MYKPTAAAQFSHIRTTTIIVYNVCVYPQLYTKINKTIKREDTLVKTIALYCVSL